MASRNFDEALRRLLRDEGGYGNHPSDPGGPTNFGITLADAQRYWKSGATADDVRAMPQSVARDIYRQRYWSALRCDALPDGVDYAVFDYGVNSGIGRAGKVLRRKLGLPDHSGTVTDTVIAATAKTDPAQLVTAICTERLAFLKALKTWPVFGRGWSRRVAGVQAAALVMARKTPPAESPAAPTRNWLTVSLNALGAWFYARRNPRKETR